MKAFLMRVGLGSIALAALIYVLACGPPSGNTNQNQNVAANSNKAVMALNACKVPSNSADHAANILKRITDEIKADDELANNLIPAPGSTEGTFTIEVQQAKGKRYFETYVKGEVRGDDNLKILSDILNNYQNDDDCMRVVYFVELNAPNSPGGGKWSSCEYPKHVCPNGECCDIEPSETPNATPTPTRTPTPLGNSGVNGTRKGNTNN